MFMSAEEVTFGKHGSRFLRSGSAYDCYVESDSSEHQIVRYLLVQFELHQPSDLDTSVNA